MDIKFCNVCDNLLFLYEDEEKNKLYYGCKACGNIEDNEEKCIYNNAFSIDISETISKNKHLKDDITLPCIENNPNIVCPNSECSSNKEGESSKIMYIKYDVKDMKYLYVCGTCNQNWKNK